MALGACMGALGLPAGTWIGDVPLVDAADRAVPSCWPGMCPHAVLRLMELCIPHVLGVRA